MVEKMNVGAICTRSVIFAYRHTSVSDAARRMRDEHVGSLVVVDEEDGERAVVGMLTDRDIAVAVVAADFNPQTTRVGDIMSADLVTARDEDSMTDVLTKMRRHGVRRVPITDAQGGLLGIATLDDMMELVAWNLGSFVQVVQSERKRETQQRE